MVSSLGRETALSRLGPSERVAVERFVEGVRELFGARLRDLRLFGSKVRGDDHDESDIDVLVLIEDATEADRKAGWEVSMSVSPWIEPHVIDFDRYHSPKSMATGFYKEMRRESVRL